MSATGSVAVADGLPGKVLTFCAEPAAMPRTGKAADGTPQGLDVAVAQAVARRLGRPIEFHWCASADCSWHCLPERRCDIVLGHPHASGPPRDVAWSVPYAGAQFGLAVRLAEERVHSLADLRGKRVGVVTGTVPLSEQDHTVLRFRSREELLHAFAASHLDAAFVDADFAGWYLHDHPDLKLRLVSDYTPREHWNMAMAVRASDASLLVEINRALAQLAEDGELKRIYNALGVTYRAPFNEQAGRQATLNTWQRIEHRGELAVCFDPANLPYSAARDERSGFEVELAEALARQLHVKLRVDWLDIQRETAMGRLLEHECDLVIGAVVDPGAMEDDEELAGKVIYSRPYCGTGYLIVCRKNGPRAQSLAELKGKRSERLGTEAGSIADYRLRQRGYMRRLYRNQLATLTALDRGEIDFAYLWPNVGWLLHKSPEFALEIVPDSIPEDRWNVAIAMRQGDAELKGRIDSALDVLIKDGTISRLMKPYYLPNLPPFGDTGAPSSDAVIHHPVANRGREPQMQRVQGSRHPYHGLERIRSAGELVVGLDQNNLPFSTAHPTPAGLDYEVARLLADQLGVTLRIYWAYSSHDSYPSKLASKKLCDVILGVSPDDRFEQRVLFSRPYSMATYQLVVRSGAGEPGTSEAVGVEEGVAVRGLSGRTMRTYPSTEAILEAVAAGKLAAGYVISTRASWLAQQRWPGQLQFLPADEPADRFPICAAVRKNEPDLNDAINQAWDDLERSGKLAAVFARWHVPYRAENRNEKRR